MAKFLFKFGGRGYVVLRTSETVVNPLQTHLVRGWDDDGLIMNFKKNCQNLVARSCGRPAAVTDHYRPGPWARTSGAAVLALFAATTAMPQEGSKNRIAVSYRPGWNVKTTFSGIGGFAPQSNPGPATGGVDHEYDDGYVRVDSTNSGLDLTWNWGFERPDQVSGDNLFMRSARGVGDGTQSETDFQHGLEVTLARELGVYGKMRWGVEGALNYLYVGAKSSGAARVTLVNTVDTYDLDGVDPFTSPGSGVPNQGTFFGPGPLIGDAPISRHEEVIPGGAVATGTRELDAHVLGLRVGPYLDLPLSDKWVVTLNGGFALAAVASDFKFSETVSAPNLASTGRRGSDSDAELLPGGYVGANIAFQMTPATRLFAGAEYQFVGDFTQSESGKRAKVDLGKTVFVKVGVSFSF